MNGVEQSEELKRTVLAGKDKEMPHKKGNKDSKGKLALKIMLFLSPILPFIVFEFIYFFLVGLLYMTMPLSLAIVCVSLYVASVKKNKIGFYIFFLVVLFVSYMMPSVLFTVIFVDSTVRILAGHIVFWLTLLLNPFFIATAVLCIPPIVFFTIETVKRIKKLKTKKVLENLIHEENYGGVIAING